jgi:long-chain acyl-CoA synthetase
MKTVQRIFDLPYLQLETSPLDGAFNSKINGVWEKTSTKDFIKAVETAAKGLIALGVKSKDMVGLVSTNKLEWDVMDIAILSVGAVSVPIYPNISISDYTYIFNDATISVAFVGSVDLYNKIEEIRPKVASLGKVFCFEKGEGIPYWKDLDALVVDMNMEEIDARKALVKRSDLATLIYTSGTTGFPKGVMLSHDNLLSDAEACFRPFPVSKGDRVLTFLPTCHVYERMLHYLYMYTGCSIYYAESLETISINLKEVQPHLFTAVPRLIEKLYDKIMDKGEELTGFKRKLFFWAVKLAEEFEIEGKSPFYKLKLALARKLIFSKWKEALGGNVKAVASGSAALQPRLARIFYAAGIPILEGYGLTETSPAVSVNCLKKGVCFGTVGPLVDGVEVKIAEDGEICVRGAIVMMGYYNLPDKTAEVMDQDGWFHTGDIGEFVHGKFLKITDRKKEIFKTSGGKYIVPQFMENMFKSSRFIEQIMVIGEGEKFPGALVVLNFGYVKDWAKHKGINIGNTNAELVESEELKAVIFEEIEHVNAELGSWEKIKRFALIPNDWSIEGGELTPTLKLKRKVIMEKYADLVVNVFANEDRINPRKCD